MRKADNKAIVIKREEVVEGEAHGGAWKVAYADFVTAMMAFFLLMWLLNATTEDQRKGLADYFSPNNLMSHASSGTGDPFGGHTAFDSGAMVSDRGAVQVLVGNHPTSTEHSSAMAQAVPPQPAARHSGGKGRETGEVGASGIQPGSSRAEADRKPPRAAAQGALARPDGQMGQGAQPDQGAEAAQGATGQAVSAEAAAAALAQAAEPPQANPVPGTAAASGTASAGGRQAAANPGSAGGTAAVSRAPTEAELRAAAEHEEAAAFAGAAKDILRAVRGDPALADLAGQLKIDMTPEGLRIQILDQKRRSMFALSSAEPNDWVRMLLEKVTPVLLKLPEQISIAGYTDATPFPGPGRTNWDLSSDRANAARRLLVEDGLPDSRIQAVTGHADREPLLPATPFAAANRRIAIVVLRDPAESAPLVVAPAR